MSSAICVFIRCTFIIITLSRGGYFITEEPASKIVAHKTPKSIWASVLKRKNRFSFIETCHYFCCLMLPIKSYRGISLDSPSKPLTGS